MRTEYVMVVGKQFINCFYFIQIGRLYLLQNRYKIKSSEKFEIQ